MARWKLAASRPGAALALLCVAQFVVVLDVTIVNVALPSVRDALALPAADAHWVITAYAVVFAAALLAGGRAADVYGRRRVFVIGLALFTLCSLVAGLAWSGPALVGARAVQGFGAAMLSPAAFAIVVTTFPAGAPRNRALGVWASVAGMAAMVGVAAGGLITDVLSWRWIFLANVPVGVVALVLVPLLIAQARAGAERRLDLASVGLATAGLGAFVYAVSGLDAGRGRGVVVAIFLAGIALVVLVVRQRRVRDPLVPGVLLRSPQALGANAAGLLYGGLMLAGFLLLTLAMQVGLGYSPVEAGVGLVAARAASLVSSRLAGRLADRVGHRLLLAAGMASMAIAFASFARIDAGAGYATSLLPGLIVLGTGIPLLFVSSSAIAVERVPSEHAGVGSGLLSTSQWVGGAIGLALVPAVGSAGVEADLSRIRGAFVACALVASFGVALALVLAIRGQRGVEVAQ